MEMPMMVVVWRYIGDGMGLPCIIASSEEVGAGGEEGEGV